MNKEYKLVKTRKPAETEKMLNFYTSKGWKVKSVSNQGNGALISFYRKSNKKTGAWNSVQKAINVLSIIFLIAAVTLVVNGIIGIAAEWGIKNPTFPPILYVFFIIDGIIEFVVCLLAIIFLRKPGGPARFLVIGIIGCCVLSAVGVLSIVNYSLEKRKSATK